MEPKLTHREKSTGKGTKAETKPIFGPYVNRYEKNGRCISCGENIQFNPDKPYCQSCYDKVAASIDYESVPAENYCHACGRETETDIATPLCYSCYKKVPQLSDISDCCSVYKR